jgi:DJ-1/PfpI family
VAISYFPSEEPDAQEVIALIKAASRNGVPLPGDLREEAFCQKLVADAVSSLVNSKGLELVRSFAVAKKPIGAISDAVRLFVDANAVSGHKIGGAPSIRNLLQQARAGSSEKRVVVDDSFVTTQDADSIASFNEAFAQICSEHKNSTGGRALVVTCKSQ